MPRAAANVLARLFPNNKVGKNLVGSSVNSFSRFAPGIPSFSIEEMRTFWIERKAASVPEKNADKQTERKKIIVINICSLDKNMVLIKQSLYL